MTTIVGHLKTILELDSANYEAGLKKAGKATGAAAAQIQTLASNTSQNSQKLLRLADAANVNVYAMKALGTGAEAAAVGVNVLRTSVSVLGGPAGIAVAAAVSLAMLAFSTREVEDNTAKYNARLMELRGNVEGLKLQKLREEFDETDKKMTELREKWRGGATGLFVSVEQFKADQAALAKLGETKAELDRQINQQQAIVNAGITDSAAQKRRDEAAAREREQLESRLEMVRQSLYSEEQAVAASYINKMAIIQESEALRDVTDAERNALRLAAAAEFEAGLTEIAAKEAEKRQKNEEQYSKAVDGMRASVANNAVGFMRAIAPESKAAALAGIAVAKAQALAANNVATLSAATLAYSSQLVPGDPTSVVRAEAARQSALTMGAINAGLIVATGLAEASSVMSSGGSSGGGSSASSSPVTTQPATPETASSTQTSGNAVYVQFVGDVYGMDDFEQVLVEVLRDTVNNGDTVIIDANSRQAMELMA